MEISKKGIFYSLILSILLCFILTGCSSKISKQSFDSLSEDSKKDTRGIDNEIDAKDLIDETEDTSKENSEETYDSFSKKNNENYYSGMNELLRPSKGNGQPLSKTLLMGFYTTYVRVKMWSPLICFFSFFVGMMIFIFAKGNKALRKWSLFGLAIGLPCCLIFIVFGVGLLNNLFLY